MDFAIPLAAERDILIIFSNLLIVYRNTPLLAAGTALSNTTSSLFDVNAPQRAAGIFTDKKEIQRRLEADSPVVHLHGRARSGDRVDFNVCIVSAC
jgi:hypothetical protein